jgi:hypothetical protein
MEFRLVAFFLFSLALSGCSSGPPELPYPAYVQVDELDDIFMASLPGVRAKQLAGDPMTRRTSNRIDLPRDWTGTSGASPGRSLEIFVLAGELSVADISLRRGGYAYLPAGSLGFKLTARGGARILYFLNDTDTRSVIRSPIIINSDLLPWIGTEIIGAAQKDLRSDPGTGARTWLIKIAAGTVLPWESSSALREGYLTSGGMQLSECVNGEVHTAPYLSGGYFFRPSNTINGGPASIGEMESVWFLREASEGAIKIWPGCEIVPVAEESALPY